MARSSTPTTAVQKRGHARARNLRRDVIASIIHAADDAGISRRALCTTAGVGPNTLTALERDDREPTLEVLSRLAAALGGELSVRFHPGTGPSIRDHLQAAMTECLVQSVHERWRVELEVSVFAPTRGVIDVVLRDGAGTVIACEAQSEVRRLEQVIRWARIKSEALGPSGPGEPASRMLLLASITVDPIRGRPLCGDPESRLSRRSSRRAGGAGQRQRVAGFGHRLDGCSRRLRPVARPRAQGCPHLVMRVLRPVHRARFTSVCSRALELKLEAGKRHRPRCGPSWRRGPNDPCGSPRTARPAQVNRQRCIDRARRAHCSAPARHGAPRPRPRAIADAHVRPPTPTQAAPGAGHRHARRWRGVPPKGPRSTGPSALGGHGARDVV